MFSKYNPAPITSAKTIAKKARRMMFNAELEKLKLEYNTATQRFHTSLNFFMRVHTWPKFGTKTIRAYWVEYNRGEYTKHNSGLRWLNRERQQEISTAAYRAEWLAKQAA